MGRTTGSGGLHAVLPDAAKLQEEEARFANKVGSTKHAPALPLFTVQDAHQALGTLQALDARLAEAGLDRTRIVKAEVVVTDHDNKPAFDEVWATWMPAGQGPVRSFVESRMPAGDLVEIIITAALPA